MISDVEYFIGNTKEEKLLLIRSALESELYVNGWSLKGIYDKILETSSDRFFVCLAVKNGLPIGIALCLMYGHISFFVKDNYRRKGIGKKLHIEILKSINQPELEIGLYGECGNLASKLFFRNIDICLMD